VLAGKQKPNLGKYENPPDWQEILAHFRGSELQNYFTKILEDNLKAIIKPQYVDHIPKAIPAGSTVQDILTGESIVPKNRHSDNICARVRGVGSRCVRCSRGHMRHAPCARPASAATRRPAATPQRVPRSER
jgi:translation initiation factor RLI1